MFRKAFTLIEVNLAMLIMAGGILSIVGLYAFGFRENRQSREDVAAATLADAVVSPLVMAISATNLLWSEFRQAYNQPSKNGWRDYINENSGQVETDPEGRAASVFSSSLSHFKASQNSISTAWPNNKTSSGMSCGLVVLHEKDSPVVRIGFRATKTVGSFLSMPLFYTEVRFQGVIDQ